MHIRRYSAAMESLSARAELGLAVISMSDAVDCSNFGDTDRVIRISVGDAEGTENIESRRWARWEGDLILHRTVGHRAEWRLGVGCLSTRSKKSGELDQARIDPVFKGLDPSTVLDADGVGPEEFVVFGGLTGDALIVAMVRDDSAALCKRIVAELAAISTEEANHDELKLV